MHELLSISDILVTDYSSSIFDFALLEKPIFIYAKDYHAYNRGTYLKLEDLPYPFANDEGVLLNQISNFDFDQYLEDIRRFDKEVLGNYEAGNASASFYEWMTKQ